MATPKGNEHKRIFKFRKETKGAWQMEEEGTEQLVGSLYLRKEKVPTQPTRVEMTLNIS